MRARALHFPPGADPEALVQVAQHLTPELVLQPRFMDHPNGATAVTEAVVCTADPEALAAKYARYTGCPVRSCGPLRVVDLGHSRVVAVHPDHLGEVVPDCVPPVLPFLAGFTVSTANLDLARAALADGRVPARVHAGRLLVHPRDGCGSAVVFEPEGASRCR
jgi:hypothetical protein